MKHVIYFTITAVLILGLFIGMVLKSKGFEPRAEFEKHTTYDKAKMILSVALYSLIFYLAGTEYHELKKRIKSIEQGD